MDVVGVGAITFSEKLAATYTGKIPGSSSIVKGYYYPCTWECS